MENSVSEETIARSYMECARSRTVAIINKMDEDDRSLIVTVLMENFLETLNESVCDNDISVEEAKEIYDFSDHILKFYNKKKRRKA